MIPYDDQGCSQHPNLRLGGNPGRYVEASVLCRVMEQEIFGRLQKVRPSAKIDTRLSRLT